jgi:hypothetical protein
MDLVILLTVIGIVVAIVIPFVVYKLTARKPRVFFDTHGNGVLSRCLTKPLFKEGWGIVTITGKLRVSHQAVTVVDAQLSYKMDRHHVRPSTKSMGKTFPPLFVFQRVANDETFSTVAFSRQNFDTIKLVPGEGEKPYCGHFTLGGNFAEEYSADFFGGKFSTLDKMFIPMMIRFEYEHNGRFYWTNRFNVLVCEFGNMGWTPQGPKYIDEEGRLLDVEYSQPVDWRTGEHIS